MLKAWIKQEQEAHILDSFSLAKQLVNYNFGAYHPLHATFNGFLA